MTTNVNAVLQKASLHTDEDRLISPLLYENVFSQVLQNRARDFSTAFLKHPSFRIMEMVNFVSGLMDNSLQSFVVVFRKSQTCLPSNPSPFFFGKIGQI